MKRRFFSGLCLTLTTFAFLLPGCASRSAKVIERADDESKPGWARVTVPSYEENGKKYFVGFVEVDGDSSRSGAMNMSDEKALSEPMRALVDNFLDQNQVGETLRKDGYAGQRVISATRGFRVPMPSLTIVNRYWETVLDGPHGATSTRAYSLAEISIVDFEKAKRAYFERLSSNTEVKQILRDVGRRQRDNVLNAPTAQN